jgi:single-strand DNA-binding protein
VNVAILQGRLSSPPRLTTLPSGDALLALEVTVRPDGARPDSVPVSWFGPPSAAVAWPTGHEVVVVGRIRRRWFRAGTARASRTEVVATAVVPAGRRAAVARAIGRALAGLEGLPADPPG